MPLLLFQYLELFIYLTCYILYTLYTVTHINIASYLTSYWLSIHYLILNNDHVQVIFELIEYERKEVSKHPSGASPEPEFYQNPNSITTQLNLNLT